MTRPGPAERLADPARPAPARLWYFRYLWHLWHLRHLRHLWLTSACWLWLAPACWTSAAPSSAPSGPPSAPSSGPSSRDPAAPCPARLIGLVHDAATGAPLAGATVVVETDRGRVAAELTDARGRFETAAVPPPARLRIYHGAHAAWHRLEACQPPLRLGVRLTP